MSKRNTWRRANRQYCRAVATDGHRLAKVENDMPTGTDNIPGVIVPKKTINELSKAIDDKDNSYVIISKINSGNVKIDPIPLNPITIRDRFRKFIGIVKYL